uniref:Head head-tail joining protein W n=1 Tax=Salmonella phage PMBT21 TaxID=3153512 RepID=A0AAU8GJP2_9CAUD
MTPEECRAQYRLMLKDAMDAYHQLNLGGSVRVVVDQNSERVEYTAANRQSLWAYIVRLQNAINSDNPCAAFMGLPSSPAGFLFP